MQPRSLATELGLTPAQARANLSAVWRVAAQYTGISTTAQQLAHTCYAQDLALLYQRYDALTGAPRATLAALSAQTGLSRVRVRARLARILAWLRAPAQRQHYLQ